MTTKAYLMIRIKKEFCRDGRIEDMLAELETIPEVKCIEQIDGVCDLLVKIEAPIRAVFVANKVLVMDGVEHLRLLKVEPFHTRRHKETVVPEVLKLAEKTKSRLVAEAEQYMAAVAAKARPVDKEYLSTKR